MSQAVSPPSLLLVPPTSQKISISPVHPAWVDNQRIFFKKTPHTTPSDKEKEKKVPECTRPKRPPSENIFLVIYPTKANTYSIIKRKSEIV